MIMPESPDHLKKQILPITARNGGECPPFIFAVISNGIMLGTHRFRLLKA
jgi:hypothetical protein